MELFSEIYGCYFTVVAHILEQAQRGLTKHEIEQFVNEYGFKKAPFIFFLPFFQVNGVC